MIKPTSSFPVFIVKRLNEAKAFYSDHFDFNVVFENEWYLHLASESGIQIGFMLPNLSIQPDMFHPSYDGNGVIFSLEVDDVDLAYSEATGKSLNIVLELRSEDWGQRHFCVKDPNGIYLDIIQSIDPTEEYQQGYETE